MLASLWDASGNPLSGGLLVGIHCVGQGGPVFEILCLACPVFYEAT